MVIRTNVLDVSDSTSSLCKVKTLNSHDPMLALKNQIFERHTSIIKGYLILDMTCWDDVRRLVTSIFEVIVIVISILSPQVIDLFKRTAGDLL